MDNGKQVKSWRKYIGRRVLVNQYVYLRDNLIEATVLEVSPRGRVKFRYPSGAECWEGKEEYGLVDVLPETPTWDNRDNRMAYPQSSAAVQPKTTAPTQPQPGDVSMDLFFKLLPADWCLLKVEPRYKTQGYYAEIWVGPNQLAYCGDGDAPSEALAEALADAIREANEI